MKKKILIVLALLALFPLVVGPMPASAATCGEYGCEPGEDHNSCPQDCPAGDTCGTCSGWETCPNGVDTYKVVCCCTGGCDPCGGAGRICSDVPACPPGDFDCSTPEDCPNLSVQQACGSDACIIDKKCRGGTCEYDCIGSPPCGGETPTTVCPSAPIISLSSSPYSVEAADDIILSWADVGNNDSYSVQRRPCSGSYVTIASGLGANSTSYTDSTATACNCYQYRVGAVKAACPTVWSNEPQITQGINPPTNTAASLVEPGNPGSNILVTWTDNSAIELQNRIQKELGAGWFDWTLSGAVTGTGSVIDTTQPCCGSIPPANVGYRVRAERSAQNCYSSYSGTSLTCPGLTCDASLSPSSRDIIMGETEVFNVGVDFDCGTINRIELYEVGGSLINNINPSSPYSEATNVDITVGTTLGSTSIQEDAYLNPNGDCSDTATINVIPPPPWFQTQGGDVHAQESIRSRVPITVVEANRYFSLVGSGGYPGLVSQGDYLEPDFKDNFGWSLDGKVSEKGWLAEDGFLLRYDYNYFSSKLISPTTDDNFSCDLAGAADCESPPPNTTTVYYSENDVDIDSLWAIPGNTKVIVLIKGNLNIMVPPNKIAISVPIGSFLAFIVSGNININGNLGDKSSDPFDGFNAHLQGMYIADGVIDTDSTGVSSGRRLVLAGTFYSGSGFNLDRELKEDPDAEIQDSSTPGELFIARPDLFVNMPEELMTSFFLEQEVAP